MGDICRESPVHINVGSLDLRTAHTIRQYVEVVSPADKKHRLRRLLEKVMDGSKILIFAQTKREGDDLTREMRTDGFPALCIHGDKKQEEREGGLKEFKEGKSPILVATDVASRGLDVKDIKYVINYDFPNKIEDYIHRVGRQVVLAPLDHLTLSSHRTSSVTHQTSSGFYKKPVSRCQPN